MTLLPVYRLGQTAFNKYKKEFEIDLFYSSIFNITNFHSSDIELDFTEKIVTFERDKKGIYVRPLTIKQWHIGFDYNMDLFGYKLYEGKLFYRFVDYVIDWGLSIEGTKDRGIPVIKLYDVVVDEGSSYFDGGELFA